MSRVLPALRQVLDIMPSPEPDRPGLIIRDPLQYTKTVMYVPPMWILALRCLDGEHSELDVQEILTRAKGKMVFGSEVREFVSVLREHGFLETEEFHRLREQTQKEFQAGRERLALHAGTAYPADPEDVRNSFNEYFALGLDAARPLPDSVLGMAAPHVSPDAGQACYATTYRRLAASPALAERTFMVLGTSHWGAPNRFGLTRKRFVTPLGTLRVDTEIVDWLEENGGAALSPEDYCHAIEHSIEFQCLFLQHALGPGLKIVPILCGPFLESMQSAGAPEQNEGVHRFFEALGELAGKYSGRLFWVLGVDLAHIGRRYGDPFLAVANRGRMAEVADLDRRRLDMVCAGDARGFLDLVWANGDELRWCGYSTLYTFMKAMQQTRGRLLRYEQWNIDPQSVVSFASLEFYGA